MRKSRTITVKIFDSVTDELLYTFKPLNHADGDTLEIPLTLEVTE